MIYYKSCEALYLKRYKYYYYDFLYTFKPGLKIELTSSKSPGFTKDDLLLKWKGERGMMRHGIRS